MNQSDETLPALARNKQAIWKPLEIDWKVTTDRMSNVGGSVSLQPRQANTSGFLALTDNSSRRSTATKTRGRVSNEIGRRDF